jgi:predicted nucleotidyltransferase
MVAEPVVMAVRRYLRALDRSGINVRFGVVFGSQATGTANQWSDIDLLVVSPRFDAERTRKDIDLLWRIAARTDSRIEPVPCGERQWREDDGSAIIEIARRHGDRVDCLPAADSDSELGS